MRLQRECRRPAPVRACGQRRDRTSPALAEIQSRDLQAAARKLGMQVHLLEASTDRDFDATFARLMQLRSGGLVISSDSYFYSHGEQLAALARRYAVPAISGLREFAMAGGLMSYGASIWHRTLGCSGLKGGLSRP